MKVSELNISDKIKHWISKFKTYKIGYKDGFLQLTVMFKSPEKMLESVAKASFIKFDETKDREDVNVHFIKAYAYYKKLEDGLWMMISNHFYKQNTLVRNITDPTSPQQYYLLNIYTREIINDGLQDVLERKDKGFNSDEELKSETWSAYKPGKSKTNKYYKNQYNKNVSLFFTKEWLEKNFGNKDSYHEGSFIKFMESDADNLQQWDKNYAKNKINFFERALEIVENSTDKGKETKILKKMALEMFNYFLKTLNKENFFEEYFEIDDVSRRQVKTVTDYLEAHLYEDFPGLDKLTEISKATLTKMKNDFKAVHNQTFYQYFSHLQMQEAKRLIEEGNAIKDVAAKFHYSNVSKFTQRFKNEFNVLPSDIKYERTTENKDSVDEI